MAEGSIVPVPMACTFNYIYLTSHPSSAFSRPSFILLSSWVPLLWPVVFAIAILSFMPPALAPFLNQVNFLLFTIPVYYSISLSPLFVHLHPGAPSSAPSFPLDTSKARVSTRFRHSGSAFAEPKIFFPYLFSPSS